MSKQTLSTFSTMLVLLSLLPLTLGLTSQSFPGAGWRTIESPFALVVDESEYVSKYTGVNSTVVTEVNPFRNLNSWINSLLFPEPVALSLYTTLGGDGSYYFLCYCRNLFGGMLIYYITAGAFHYVNYVRDAAKLFVTNGGPRPRPTRATIVDQIVLAQSSLFLYVALPVFSDWLIESGYTASYYSIGEIGGWLPYLAYTLFYFCLVEIGIYWMHRTLHTNKWLYNNVHARHHAYSKPETLTPWASIAFNPIDGILQASPYVFWLLFVPCHYITHMVMLFATAVWATYIHDSMDGDYEPIMTNKVSTHTLMVPPGCLWRRVLTHRDPSSTTLSTTRTSCLTLARCSSFAIGSGECVWGGGGWALALVRDDIIYARNTANAAGKGCDLRGA